MKSNLYKRIFYVFLPVGLMAIGFGLETYSSYQHQATGKTLLYGAALLAIMGLVLYFSLSRKSEPLSGSYCSPLPSYSAGPGGVSGREQ